MLGKDGNVTWQGHDLQKRDAVSCKPKDSDAYLKSSPGWSFGCSNYWVLGYCNSWGKDVRRCCPETCGTGEFNEEDCNSFDGKGSCIYPYDAQCPQLGHCCHGFKLTSGQHGQRRGLRFAGNYRKQTILYHDRVLYFNNNTQHYLFYAGLERNWVVGRTVHRILPKISFEPHNQTTNPTSLFILLGK